LSTILIGVDDLISLPFYGLGDDKVQRLAGITPKIKARRACTLLGDRSGADLLLDQKVIPPFLRLLKL
jgi:hypothetical protein